MLSPLLNAHSPRGQREPLHLLLHPEATGRRRFSHAFYYVMRGLDPRICRWREMAGLIPGSKSGDGHDEFGHVIPAQAGIQLHATFQQP